MSLENLKNLIPFLYLLLIISSAVKIITYYDGFGIAIVDYMELSEFIFSFLDDLYGYIVMLLGILIWGLIDDIIYPENGVSLTKEKLRKGKRKLYRDFAATLLLIYGATTVTNIWFINWIVYVIAAISTLVAYVFFYYRSQSIGKLTKYYFLIPTLLVYGYLDAKFDLSVIKEKKNSFNVVLILKDETVKTDSANRYLGKTNNYIFFYNIESKTATAYPNRDIMSIKINKE